eukprot:214862-Pleurochrysis_carterae.AAC.1
MPSSLPPSPPASERSYTEHQPMSTLSELCTSYALSEPGGWIATTLAWIVIVNSGTRPVRTHPRR